MLLSPDLPPALPTQKSFKTRFAICLPSFVFSFSFALYFEYNYYFLIVTLDVEYLRACTVQVNGVGNTKGKQNNNILRRCIVVKRNGL